MGVQSSATTGVVRSSMREQCALPPLVTLPSLLEPSPLLYFSSQCLAAAVATAVAGGMRV